MTTVIPGPNNAEPRVETLAQSQAAMERILAENLLPFWRVQAVRDSGPGYTLNHDVQGRFLGRANLRLVSQARALWGFSQLMPTRWGIPSDQQYAAHGFAILTRLFRDPSHGGFYWELDSSGSRPTMPDKQLYGHAFALFALATHAIADRSAASVAAAREAFLVLEDRFRDREHGGYFEVFRHDWGRKPVYRAGYLGAGSSLKLLNSHIHVLEALLAYLRLTGDTEARDRIEDLSEILATCMRRAPAPHFPESYFRDWTPACRPGVRRQSYGHDLETVMLLIRASALLHTDDTSRHDAYFAIADTVSRCGADPVHGGLFASGPVGKPADHRVKMAWVQAEALVAFDAIHRLSGDPAHGGAFLHTLNWVLDWQCDWEGGEWFPTIDTSGMASGLKAGPWGGPYHNVRAILDSLDQTTNRSASNDAH